MLGFLFRRRESPTLSLGSFLNPRQTAMGIATTEPVTISENQSVEDAIKVVFSGKRRMPVVDSQKSIKGLLSATDILDFLGAGPKYRMMGSTGIRKNVSSIMSTNILAIEKNYTTQKAFRAISGQFHGTYPVLDNGSVVGMLSEMDFIQRIVGPTGIHVEDIMTKKVMHAKPMQPVRDVAKIMVRSNYRRLPVIQKGILMGMLTPYDIIRHLHANDRIHWLEKDMSPVSNAMRKQLATSKPDEDIAVAAQRMKVAGVGGLPVIYEGHVAGIVTKRDIFEAIN